MAVIMDGLLIAGTLFAGLYCWVLSGRVRALKSLDTGLGGAIVTLTRQIELARTTLDEARQTSSDSGKELEDLVARAESASRQLRLLMAAASKEPALRDTRKDAAATAPRARTPEPYLQERDLPGPEPEPERETEPETRLPTWAPATLDLLSVRRKASRGPQLVTLAQVPNDQGGARDEEHGEATLPKPRKMANLDAVLRRRTVDAAPALRTEEDLMAALTALAAGGDR